jgi:hypothetical protein
MSTAEQTKPDKTTTRDPVTGKLRVDLLLWLLFVNLAILGLGIASTFYDSLGVAGYALALVAMGIFTFSYLFADSSDIRTAVTVAFVFVFLGLLAGSFNDTISTKLSKDFGKTIFDSFNALLTVIIGFYFGGKAWERASRRRNGT